MKAAPLLHYDKSIREHLVALSMEVNDLLDYLESKNYEPTDIDRVLATIKEWTEFVGRDRIIS